MERDRWGGEPPRFEISARAVAIVEEPDGPRFVPLHEIAGAAMDVERCVALTRELAESEARFRGCAVHWTVNYRTHPARSALDGHPAAGWSSWSGATDEAAA